LLPAFGVGFFAARCVCGARGGWRRAGVAALLCMTAAAVITLNRGPLRAKGEQLQMQVQKWNDQRVAASAQRTLREMPTIDRVEIRANDGSPMTAWSLQRTITGSEAEELAARWRGVGFHYDRKNDGFDYGCPLYELCFYRSNQLVQSLKTGVGYMRFRLDAGRYRDRTFWFTQSDEMRMKLGDIIPVDAVRALAAEAEAYSHWSERIGKPRAIELVQRAAALDPQNARYSYDLGYFYREIGEQQRAVEAFSRAIVLDRRNALTLFLRAECYEKLGRPADAIADYDTLLNADPSDAPAFYRRGVLYFEQGDFIRAIADLDSALSIGLYEEPAARAKLLRSRAFKLFRQASAPAVKAKPPPATTSSQSATGR
ncbi:MAG TPA: tetratricopeptide repeat protein, partial [Pirellulales bacterium]